MNNKKTKEHSSDELIRSPLHIGLLMWNLEWKPISKLRNIKGGKFFLNFKHFFFLLFVCVYVCLFF